MSFGVVLVYCALSASHILDTYNNLVMLVSYRSVNLDIALFLNLVYSVLVVKVS